jgi:putative ABC transport system permease protein
MAIPLIYNIRSVRQRIASTIIAIIAIAGVVLIFIAMLSMAKGFQKTMVESGSNRNAIVLQSGLFSEMTSVIPYEDVNIIGDMPGVLKGTDGQPQLAAEVVVVATLPQQSSGADINVSIRGTSEKALKIRDDLEVMEGRYFRPGLAELVVGQNVIEKVEGFKLSNNILFGGQTWKIVGAINAGGSVFDSEVWCDANVLNQVYKRPDNTFQSVTVRLTSPEALKLFVNSLKKDPRLNVDAKHEIDYYSEQSETFSRLIMVIGLLLASIMAIGAVFGALNTMYSAVAARIKEIATLRAIGFSDRSVVLSFIFESLFISLIGGLLGSLIILPIQGITTSTINLQTFSNVTFSFTITIAILLKGLIFSLSIGFLGGLLPAFQASRLPIAKALRSL